MIVRSVATHDDSDDVGVIAALYARLARRCGSRPTFAVESGRDWYLQS